MKKLNLFKLEHYNIMENKDKYIYFYTHMYNLAMSEPYFNRQYNFKHYIQQLDKKKLSEFLDLMINLQSRFLRTYSSKIIINILDQYILYSDYDKLIKFYDSIKHHDTSNYVKTLKQKRLDQMNKLLDYHIDEQHISKIILKYSFDI